MMPVRSLPWVQWITEGRAFGAMKDSRIFIVVRKSGGFVGWDRW